MHSRLPMIERPDPWIEALVDVAFAQIIYDDGTVSRSALAIRDYMTWLANRSYEKGRETARRGPDTMFDAISGRVAKVRSGKLGEYAPVGE